MSRNYSSGTGPFHVGITAPVQGHFILDKTPRVQPYGLMSTIVYDSIFWRYALFYLENYVLNLNGLSYFYYPNFSPEKKACPRGLGTCSGS